MICLPVLQVQHTKSQCCGASVGGVLTNANPGLAGLVVVLATSTWLPVACNSRRQRAGAGPGPGLASLWHWQPEARCHESLGVCAPASESLTIMA